MKRLTRFWLRHGTLPTTLWWRRRMLRSIFRPANSRDYDLSGWYDLGQDVSPEEVARFKAWQETDRG